MKGKMIPVLCAVLAVAALALAFTLGWTEQVFAFPSTVVYNLYATDGYIEMADGVPVYAYGFIGGREGTTFTYTESYCTGDGVARTCKDGPIITDPSILVYGNLTGTALAPTGGPWTTNDALLAGNAQFPAPIVFATTGDVVEIRLKNLGVTAQPNAPNDPHSIHLHGLDVDAANDGVPETSLGAVPANLCDNGATDARLPPVQDCKGLPDPNTGAAPFSTGYAPGAGNVIVYMFSPAHAGTYMYHCHQEADIHVNMGMFGALVVYNPGDPAGGSTCGATGTEPCGPGKNLGGMLYGMQYDKDYVMLLGEFDIRGHADEEGTYALGGLLPPNTWDPDPFNWALYRPQYWFVNGISFPNTIHANFPSTYTFVQWHAAHPGYDPLITGSVGKPNAFWGTKGEKVLIRVINMGFETQPMHMHGYHGKVLGSDQRAWDWTFAPKSKTSKTGARPFGEGLEKNTLTIGSGETYDWLVDFGQQDFQSTYPNGLADVPPVYNGTFAGGTQSRYYDGLTGGLCEADIIAAGLPVPAPNTPVSNTFVNCPAIPDAGDPANAGIADYIGGPVVTGLVGHPALSQYFPFHNHDDYKATNNGVYPGGMFTFLVPTSP